MTDTLSDNELIDRYVHAVLVHIPRSQREAAADRLRARITGESSGRATREVLVELGPPEDQARRFRGAPRQLIGPRLYDTYLRVLWPTIRVVALVVGGVSLLAATVDEGTPEMDGGVLAEAITSAFSGAVYTAVWVTVVFAVIERTAPGAVLREWRPDDLPPVPRGHEIPLGDAIADLVFGVAVLVGCLCLVPALAPSFLTEVTEHLDPGVVERLLPLAVAVAALWVIVAIAQLVVRAWTLPVTAVSIVADLLAVLTAAAVLVHRPYVSPEFLADIQEGQDSDLGRALDIGIGIGAIAVILVCGGAVVTTARKFLAHRRA
ncbi:hypothetical protein [Nocardia higoensis]|uniref:hypothetical protein n=1 Tax=Nocardia higoensis TaxID=228599 RepID=UPI000594CD18|nr:hypothetical protein [Nocardia higoensis]